MAGKNGQKISKENSKRQAEYYKKNFPDWTIEQCEEAAKKFRKSCNSGTIEYWMNKYPELSIDECEKIRKKYLQDKKSNNSNYLEYYIKSFPNNTLEENKELLNKHIRENNFQCIEYWIKRYPNATLDECKIMLDNKKKEYLSKRPDNSGINNPMHRSKVSVQKTKECSPMCIEFYQKHYPNLSKEEQEKMWREKHDKINETVRNTIKTTNIEYYLNQGMSEEDAKKALHDRQATFTIEKCIKKYGEEEGIKRFNNRQEVWIKSLKNHFKQNGNKINKLYFRSSLQESIENKLKESFPDIENEFYIFDNKQKRGYSYDIRLNNKLIEINGDYWHANPKLYDGNFLIRINKKEIPAKDIWLEDKYKKSCARRNKYKILYIWESDYNNNPEKEIKRCIKFLQS